MTSVTGALESLELQKQRHQSEISVIRHKQRCEEMKKTSTSPPFRSPSRPEETNHAGFTSKKMGTVDELDGHSSVYRTMEECDSLLAFLRNRSSGRNIDQNAMYVEKPHGKIGGIKNPKDDKTIIEELRVHNEALRSHILELLRENEGYYKELQSLRKENVDCIKVEVVVETPNPL